MDALTFAASAELAAFVAGTARGCIAVDTPAGRGEEEALLDAARALLGQGRSVLFLCADEIYAERLRALNAEQAALPQHDVTTVQARALEVMGEQAAQRAVRRRQRVLDQNEVDILIEDVKVCGIKPKRLREMLKFFFNSISNSVDDTPTWLISTEEQTVYAVLEENLEARGALLPCELTPMAFRALERTGAELRGRFSADCVFAVGYDQMSYGSQRLARSLARELFVATSSSTQTPCAGEPYPCPQAFDELKAQGDCANCSFAPQREPASCDISVAQTPGLEFEAVADGVERALAAGAAESDLLVGVPNGVWASRIAELLQERGVFAAVDLGPKKLPGDPRLAESCEAMAARAFFQLWLDRDDMTAMRTWIGLGDWLLCSEAFLEVLAYAKEAGCTAQQAVRTLWEDKDAARERVLFHKIAARLDQLQELRDTYRAGSSAAISAAFNEQQLRLSADAAAFLGSCGPRLTEAELNELARAGLAAAEPFDRTAVADAVLVAPYRRCLGRSARQLFLAGMVNGFLPSLRAVDDMYSIDDRAKALAKETLLFEALRALPSQALHLSLFEKDRLENAGALKVETTRVFFEDGARCARIAPSLFIAELQA